MPDPDFFRGNYQNPAQPVKPPAVSGTWSSRENPDTAVLQSAPQQKPPTSYIPDEAFLDDDLANAPAVDEDDLADAPAVEETPAPARAPIREPGVVITPPAGGVEFRDDYN